MAQLEEIKQILRSLLVSAPVKVTVSSLNRDYRSLEGRNIPFRELGYNSLLHLLYSLPDVLRVNGSSFESEVTLVVNEKVAHVNDMVMKQKMPSKGKNARASRKSVIQDQRLMSHSGKTNFDQRRNDSTKHYDIKLSTPSESFSKSSTVLSPFPKQLLPRDVKVPTFTKHVENNTRKIDLNFEGDSSNYVNDNFDSEGNSSTSSCGYINNIIASVPFSGTSPPKCERVPSLSKHMPENVDKEETSIEKESSPSQSRFEKLKLSRLKKRNEVSGKNELKTKNSTAILRDCINKSNGIISFEGEINKVPLDIQNRLRELIKLYPSGIRCTELLSLYKKRYLKNLEYQKYGFDRLISLCIHLENIFYYEMESDYDFKLYDKDNPPLIKDRSDEDNEMTKTKIVAKTVDLSQIKAVKSKDWDIHADSIPQDALKLGEVVENNSLDDYGIGNTIQIVISEIYNPSKFWIYKNDGLLNKMMNSMQIFYKENKTKYHIPEFLLEVGLYCVVHTLNEFQRALIVDLLHQIGGHVKVYLIDYGTLANLPREKIWYLFKEFCSLPAQAVETSLAGIEAREELVWSEQSICRFKEMVDSKQLFAKILDKKEQTLYISISVMSMPLKTLNDLLVQEGHAKYVANCKFQDDSTKLLKDSSEEVNPRKKFIEKLRSKNKMLSQMQ